MTTNWDLEAVKTYPQWAEAEIQKLRREKAELVETLLPERLDRDLATPLCEIDCIPPCDGDCDCNEQVQVAWRELRERLIARAENNDDY